MAWMDNYLSGLFHQQQLRMFNQLDSHDTARFKTLLGKDMVHLSLSVIWLFTLLSVPYSINYGDEVRVNGANDPLCRKPKPFPWDESKQDDNLLALYAEGGVYARGYQQQWALVAINWSDEVVLEDSPLRNVAEW